MSDGHLKPNQSHTKLDSPQKTLASSSLSHLHKLLLNEPFLRPKKQGYLSPCIFYNPHLKGKPWWLYFQNIFRKWSLPISSSLTTKAQTPLFLTWITATDPWWVFLHIPLPSTAYPQQSNQIELLKHKSDTIISQLVKVKILKIFQKTFYDFCFFQPLHALPRTLSIHCSYFFSTHHYALPPFFISVLPPNITAHLLTSGLFKYPLIGPSLIILHKTGIHLSTYHSLSLHYCFHSIEHHVICELLTFKNKQKKNLCPFTRMKFHDNKGIAISPVSKLGLGLCRHLKHLSWVHK